MAVVFDKYGDGSESNGCIAEVQSYLIHRQACSSSNLC